MKNGKRTLLSKTVFLLIGCLVISTLTTSVEAKSLENEIITFSRGYDRIGIIFDGVTRECEPDCSKCYLNADYGDSISIKFEFSYPDFGRIEIKIYRSNLLYKKLTLLEGDEVDLSTLEPGEYSFEITAFDSDGTKKRIFKSYQGNVVLKETLFTTDSSRVASIGQCVDKIIYNENRDGIYDSSTLYEGDIIPEPPDGATDYFQFITMNYDGRLLYSIDSRYGDTYLVPFYLKINAVSEDKTITVCKNGCEYQSIQDAINSADDGDNINVMSGTYYEHITIDKKLKLVGAQDDCIIDGQGTGDVVTINADGVTFMNFKVMNSGSQSAIYITSSGNLIKDNLISKSYKGFFIYNSNYNLPPNNIKGNEITDCNWAMSLRGGNFEIDNNNIHDNEYGILITESKGTITGNTIKDCKNSIFITEGKGTITGNTIKDCYSGIGIYYSTSVDVDNNLIQNTALSIEGYRSDNINITNNKLLDTYDPFDIKDCKDVYYFGNQIRQLDTIEVCPDCLVKSIQYGINVASIGDEVLVKSGVYKENVFVDKKITLKGEDTGGGKPIIDADFEGSAVTILPSATQATVEGFEIINSDCYAGIRVQGDENTIRNNIIRNNNYGVWIDNSNKNKIENNKLISNRQAAVYILNSDQGNEVKNNEIKDTWVDGVEIKESSNNLVESNTINNTYTAFRLINSEHNDIIHNDAICCKFSEFTSCSLSTNYFKNDHVEEGHCTSLIGSDTPEIPNVVNETPEIPNVVNETPEIPNVVNETPEIPEIPEIPETPSQNQLPKAEFKYSPELPVVENPVHFDASLSVDYDGTVKSYEWNFGDGTTGEGIKTAHTYDSEGEYIVTLTVTDDEGATDSYSAQVIVILDYMNLKKSYEDAVSEGDGFDEAKLMILTGIKLGEMWLDKLEEKLGGIEGLDEKTHSDINYKILTYRLSLQGSRLRVDNAQDIDELKEIALELGPEWVEIRLFIKATGYQIATAKLSKIIEKAENVELTLNNKVERLNEEGEDTSKIEELLDKLSFNINSAKENVAEVNKILEHVDDIQDINDAKDLLKSAISDLENSFEIIKTIVTEHKDSLLEVEV